MSAEQAGRFIPFDVKPGNVVFGTAEYRRAEPQPTVEAFERNAFEILYDTVLRPSPFLGMGPAPTPPTRRQRVRRHVREARSRVHLAWTALRYGEDYFS